VASEISAIRAPATARTALGLINQPGVTWELVAVSSGTRAFPGSSRTRQSAPVRTTATQLASSGRPPRTREVSGHEAERRDHAPDNSLPRPSKHEARDEGQDAEHHGEEEEGHQPSKSERRAAATAA
jgi:hypothetical protein